MEKYLICQPEESHFEPIRDFLFEDYLLRERCCVSAGIPADLAKFQDDPTVLSALLDGVSLVALNLQDQSIAGVCVNYISRKTDPPEDCSNYPPSRTAIVRMTESLYESQNTFEEANTDQGLHMWMLGVGEKHGKHGLARAFYEKTVALAKEKNLAFIDTVATCPATWHLSESFGFQVKSEIKLADFKVNGEPGFPHAQPDDAARLAVKIL